MQQYFANGWVYKELLHPVREAMIAWYYCSVLTKLDNGTLQSSSCRFSNHRALKNSIVRIIPINGRSMKAVVPTVVPTSSTHVHYPKSIVQAISINRQPAKTISGQFQLIDSLRDNLCGQFQLVESTRHQLFRQFQLMDSL